MHPSDADELSLEEVADRLGVPTELLLRRVEAGDVPARQVETPAGTTYLLRLGDLGVAGDDEAPANGGSHPADTNGEHPRRPLEGTLELSIEGERHPAAEIMAMSIDPRELVAGLLDRWERTLEQRISLEQRQRFEAELAERQSQVRQLQMELETVRAQHAAMLAVRDREMADRERTLRDREWELSEVRRSLGRRRLGFFRL